MREIQGFREIVDDYDLFLLDMWGLMHDGSQPYEGVLDVIKQLKANGKDLIILSNSSKRREKSFKTLSKLGFDPSDFTKIITSGDVGYKWLSNDASSGSEPWSVLSELHARYNRTVYVFGSGDGDRDYCESCDWRLAPIGECNLIVARGTFTLDDGSSVIDKKTNLASYEKTYWDVLEVAAERRLPMLVANPDKVRPDVERPPMPGKIGLDYEALLDESDHELIQRVGKPFEDVYKIAMSDSDVPKSRILMVGDALETDVTGGSAMGIHTAWVIKDGIHSPDLPDGSLMDGATQILKTFNAASTTTYAMGRKLTPTLIAPHFRW